MMEIGIEVLKFILFWTAPFFIIKFAYEEIKREQ